MAIELIWEVPSTLHIKYSGTVTGDDVITSQNQLSNDVRFAGVKYLILDMFEVTTNLSTDKDVEKISAMAIAHSKTLPAVKNAVIMNANEDAQTLATYYQFLAAATGWDIRLFKTEPEARTWLRQFAP